MLISCDLLNLIYLTKQVTGPVNKAVKCKSSNIKEL